MTPFRWKVSVVVLILLATLSHHAQVRRGALAEKLDRIEKAISSEMSRQNIPGLSVAIATDGALRWSNGYGLADLENFVPAKASTVYRLGSISKPITAVAVMQLAERGKLDLDAPVQKYCPAFPQKQWPVTSRQLLGHLAGVRHYNSDAEFGSTRHYQTLVEGLSMFKDDPLLHQPGTKYSYTTHGYAVLGCVVEGASGMTFKDYVNENIFKPAGMDRIRVDDVFEIIPNRAQGYAQTQSGLLRNSALADTSYKIPGGGFCSTVEDLVKFALAVQSGKLVQPQTLEQMWTKQKTADGKETSYGLGFGIEERNGLRIVSHGGGQQRVSTMLYLVPEKKITIALMLNLEGAGGSVGSLTQQITDILLDTRPSGN
jgi:CubicO group peptidase (beta-lactamase class C family)